MKPQQLEQTQHSPENIGKMNITNVML